MNQNQPNPMPACAVCGNPVEMPVPQVRFSVGSTSTAILFEHPDQVSCPTCGAVVRLQIVGFQNVHMKTVTVPKVERRRLIIPVERRLVG